MIEGNNTNTCIQASLSLLKKYGRKPLLLPIKPMGIIAYTFAFLGTSFVKIAGTPGRERGTVRVTRLTVTFALHNFINLVTFAIYIIPENAKQ